MNTIEKEGAGQVDCCSAGPCCCAPTPGGRGKRVRTVIFLVVILGAIGLAAAALASRYGWLDDRAEVAAPEAQPAGSPAAQPSAAYGVAAETPPAAAPARGPAATAGVAEAPVTGLRQPAPETPEAPKAACCGGTAPEDFGQPENTKEPCCGGAAPEAPVPTIDAPKACCGGGSPEPAPCGCGGAN
jgi:hypothetical protein